MLEFSYAGMDGKLSGEEIERFLEANRFLLKRACTDKSEFAGSLGWLDPNEWAGDRILSRLTGLAAEVREKADAFVLTGVGGSNNAARAVIEAVPRSGGAEIYYAGNTLSAGAFCDLLARLKGRSVYINVIAKNFETLEPGLAFRILRRYLEDAYGEAAHSRIICTGTPGSHLEELCRTYGYTFLTFPENIGGRYSAVTSVGLFPMAAAGLDIWSLAQGARDMKAHLSGEQSGKNAAFRYAALRNLLYQKGFRLELFSCFEPQLRYFARWLIQLFAESEGKDGKGVYPAFAEYSEDLHSVGQFVQDGSRFMYETFLQIKKQDSSLILPNDGVDDRFSYADGMDLDEINRKAFEATCKAHSRVLPCFKICMDAADEYHFGQLFYFFEFACYLSALMLGVNPFNQPGVEAYKEYMFASLGKNGKSAAPCS